MCLEPFGATGLFILGRGARLLAAGVVREKEEEEEEKGRGGRGNKNRQRGCPGGSSQQQPLGAGPATPHPAEAREGEGPGGEERGEDRGRRAADTSQSQGCPTVPQKTQEMKK